MQRSSAVTKRFSGKIPVNSGGVWKNHRTTHGFWVSGACVNIAKVEYRGHRIHGNTAVDFTVLVLRNA
jgi:hypothetical protein